MGRILEKTRFVIVAAFLLYASAQAMAQCCGAGNPISVTGSGNDTKRNHLQLSLDYRHSLSNTYYEGKAKYDGEFFGMLSDAGYDYLNFSASYGITRRWAVQTSIGYYISRRENFKLESLPDAEISGFGDLLISTSYNVWRNERRGMELSPFLSIKLPVGKFNCENGGVKLPMTMQPSSGTTKYSGGFYFYANLSRKFYCSSYNQFEISQRNVSRYLNHKYGNLLYLKQGIYYNALPKLSLGVNVSFENMGSSYDGKMPLVGTSYKLLKLIPQVKYSTSNRFHVIVSYDQPIWRKVDYIQLSNKYALQVKLMYDINLN